MLSEWKSKHVRPARRLIPEQRSRVKIAAALSVAAAFFVLVAPGARAEKPTINQTKAASKTVIPKETFLQGNITKAKTTSAQGAKAAADRSEALMHGHPLVGTNQTELIMHGYVPPGMPPQQAQMLYNSLPNNLKMPYTPRPGSAEWVSKMAGEPVDPMAGVPGALNAGDVQAANQKMFEGYMRERFGPVYIPPLHRDHNRAAAATPVTQGMVKHDHQMSLIPAQYSYDGGKAPSSIREMTNSSGIVQSEFSYDPFGRQTQIAGTGVVPDFGYAGMYVHQPSGLNLTKHRAYSSSLGRWLSRDPIQDPTFKMMPRSPEPREPHVPHASGASSMASLRSISHDPMMRAQLRKILPAAPRVGSNELNPYAYVANNPINFSDPTGLMIGMPTPAPAPNPNKPKPCPSNGGSGCHPPKGLPEWTRADCYLWCSRNCDPDDFQSCCDECDEHYDD